MSDSSDDEPIIMKKQKLNHANGSAKLPSRQSKEKVSYKEESEDEDYEDTKPKSKQKPKKVTPKSAPAGQTTATKKKSPIVKKETKEKKDAKTVLVKREKKVYENPGQTRETPDETDPSRKFYCSLHEQRPDSMMAKKWLCTHGLLATEDAEAYLAEVGKVKSPEKSKRPTKTGARSTPGRAPAKKTIASQKKPSAKRKIKKEESDNDEDDSEDEIIITKKAAPKKPLKVNGRSTRDVAFDDGGLGSSSDDDVPLAMRAK